MNKVEQLDKALCLIRELNIHEALDILYRLLKSQPDDLELIARIYPLEVRKNDPAGHFRICQWIFTIDSKTEEAHQLICSTWKDYKQRFRDPINIKNFPRVSIFNLFFHLGKAGKNADCDIFKGYIKQDLANDKLTPEALFLYCEHLVDQKKLLLAEKELEFLMIYYAESPVTLAAEKLTNRIRLRLSK